MAGLDHDWDRMLELEDDLWKKDLLYTREVQKIWTFFSIKPTC